MALRNTERSWGSLSKWLHWTIAVLMIAAIVCSVWADQLDPEVDWHRTLWQWLIMKLHKPIGFTAMVLIFVRFVWMLMNPRPALPESMSRSEVIASKLVHVTLYGLMLVVPVTGWFMSQYADSAVDFFGVFSVGNIVAPDKDMVGRLHPFHVWLGLTTAGLVLLHVLAALFHEYVRKDGVLSEMLPGREAREVD